MHRVSFYYPSATPALVEALRDEEIEVHRVVAEGLITLGRASP
jgi:hypothetical protein